MRGAALGHLELLLGLVLVDVEDVNHVVVGRHRDEVGVARVPRERGDGVRLVTGDLSMETCVGRGGQSRGGVTRVGKIRQFCRRGSGRSPSEAAGPRCCRRTPRGLTRTRTACLGPPEAEISSSERPTR